MTVDKRLSNNTPIYSRDTCICAHEQYIVYTVSTFGQLNGLMLNRLYPDETSNYLTSY